MPKSASVDRQLSLCVGSFRNGCGWNQRRFFWLLWSHSHRGRGTTIFYYLGVRLCLPSLYTKLRSQSMFYVFVANVICPLVSSEKEGMAAYRLQQPGRATGRGDQRV